MKLQAFISSKLFAFNSGNTRFHLEEGRTLGMLCKRKNESLLLISTIIILSFGMCEVLYIVGRMLWQLEAKDTDLNDYFALTNSRS